MLFKQTFAKYAVANLVLASSFVIIWGIAIWMLKNQFSEDSLEVPASWFSSLNSLYIIALAPLFSKWWESKYNPSANMKYALGMVFLAVGMITVAIGANGIEPGAKTASVSMIYLILVYLFVAFLFAGCSSNVYLFTSFKEPANEGLRILYSKDGYHWNENSGPQSFF